MNPEKQLQNAVITWLECRGAYAVSVKSGKMLTMYKGRVGAVQFAPAGTPDVHVCWQGRPLYIELKKDEATAAAWHKVVDRFIETGVCAKSNLPIITQHECHKRIMRAGGEVIVCGSLAELERDAQTLGFIPTPHSHDSARRTEEKGKTGRSQKAANGKRNTRPDSRTRKVLYITVGKKKFRIAGTQEGNRIIFDKPFIPKKGEIVTIDFEI